MATHPLPVKTEVDTAVNVSNGSESGDNIADIYAQFATYPFETDEVFLVRIVYYSVSNLLANLNGDG